MEKNITQTPAHIPDMPKKTLVVCLAHRFAKVFEFHLREIKELSLMQTSDTDYEYSDRAGYSHSSRGDGGTSTGNTENDKEHYLKVFTKYFIKELTDLFIEGKYSNIVIFVPEDMKRPVEEKLEQHIAEKTKFIHGNYASHHQSLELIEKIYKEIPSLFPLKNF